MPQPVNVWELVAKVEADFRQADRGIDTNERKVQRLVTQYKVLDKETKSVSSSQTKLSSALGGLESSITGLGGPLGGLVSRVTQLTSGFAGATAGAGPIGVALGVIATASVGAAAGIYSLTTASAEATGKFIDLSQQTGFSVETLSALANAAETSGGSIDSVVSSLFLFETKMKEAQESGSQMSKIFKQLGIDTTNNEKALRQALVALSEMTRAEDQAKVGKMLFGRSVKDLIAALKEAGDFDEFLNEQLRRGTLITTDAAKAGDKLSDATVEMRRAFEAARRVIAEEFGPDVLSAVNAVTSAIERNRSGIKDWATDIRLAIHGAVDPLAASLRNLNNILLGLAGMSVPQVLEFLFKFGTAGGLIFTGLKSIGAATQGTTPAQQRLNDMMNMDRALFGPATSRLKTLGGKNPFEATRGSRGFVMPTGGGGGRGGGRQYDPAADIKRLSDLQLQTTLETMRREEQDIERSYDKRRLTVTVFQRAISRLEDNRHQAVLEGLEKERQSIEKNPKLNQLQKSVALTELELQRAREANRHREVEIGLTEKINRATRERIVLVETLIKLQTRKRFSSDVLMTTEDGLGVIMDEETRNATTRPRRVADATRDRIVTEAEQRRRELLAERIQDIRNLAADITFTIDDAIRTGFESGIGAGIRAFGLGILEMARHAALKKLEEAIAKALTGGGALGGQGSGGGGNWFTNLIGPLISGIFGGGFGGGASAGGLGSALGGIGGLAEGGTAKPYEWKWVGERGPELARAGRDGMTVMSNQQSTSAVRQRPIVNNWYITTKDAESFTARQTQSQIKRQMMKVQETR